MERILAMKNVSLLFFVINLFPLCVYANNSTEKQLLSDIFHNYDELTRPLLNHSEHVKVKIEFSLLTVHYLDMRNQELSSSAVISISWTDDFFKWNTSSYGGLDLIRVSLSNVWKPDVILTNSVNKKDIFEETGEHVIIYNDGTVLWRSIKHLKTFVHVDTTNYPFEVQVFRFNFSKLYFDDKYQQNYYSSEDNAIANFVSNGEWVFNCQRWQTTRTYIEPNDRNGKIFSDIIWQFEMDRRQTYYVWSFLIPVAALSFVSVFTFLLPAKSSEKLTLAVFSFISMAVVIRLFNEALPSTSENISNFGRLLSINLGMAGLVIILNVIISCIYHRTFLKMSFDDQSCFAKPTLKHMPDSKKGTENIISYSEKNTQTDDSAGSLPDEITFNEHILSTISENIICLRNLMIEGIQSIKKTTEDEVNRQTTKKEAKLERSNRASKCDIVCFLFSFSAHFITNTYIIIQLFGGKPNIA